MGRKRKPLSSAPPPKKHRISEEESSLGTTTPEAPCHFLQLPAELRNEIYALICGGKREKAFLPPRSRGILVYKSSLARVNKQIRGELLSVVCMNVSNINVRVKDFNFAHVVGFYNKCDAIELKTLPTTGSASEGKRTILVTLEMTENTHNFIDGLRRWANRAAKPQKKGSSLSLQYQAVGGSLEQCGRLLQAIAAIREATQDKRKGKVLKDVMKAIIAVTWPRPDIYGHLIEDSD